MKSQNIKIDNTYRFIGLLSGQPVDETVTVMDINDKYVLMSNGFSTPIIDGEVSNLSEIKNLTFTKGDLAIDNGTDIIIYKKRDNGVTGFQMRKELFVIPVELIVTPDGQSQREEAEGNAERLITCWHSHDELLEALEDMLNLHQRIYKTAIIGQPTINRIKGILKKYQK